MTLSSLGRYSKYYSRPLFLPYLLLIALVIYTLAILHIIGLIAYNKVVMFERFFVFGICQPFCKIIQYVTLYKKYN